MICTKHYAGACSNILPVLFNTCTYRTLVDHVAVSNRGFSSINLTRKSTRYSTCTCVAHGSISLGICRYDSAALFDINEAVRYVRKIFNMSGQSACYCSNCVITDRRTVFDHYTTVCDLQRSGICITRQARAVRVTGNSYMNIAQRNLIATALS